MQQTEDSLEPGAKHEVLDPKMEDILDRYRDEMAPRLKAERKEKSRLKALRAEFEALSLSELSAQRIVQFADKRLKMVSSDAVRRDLTTLSSVIETARTLWHYPLVENPVRRAKKVLSKSRTMKPEVRRVRRISDEELSALRQELSTEMAALVGFALETALRRGELAKLTWRDIQDDRLTIRDDKTGKTTTIPLSATAVGILDGIKPARVDKDKDKDTSVFNREADSITQAFNRACVRAGIEDLRVHDLRHEATSRLFEKGLSIEQVAMITRHSDWRSLKIYTHPSLDHIKTLLD